MRALGDDWEAFKNLSDAEIRARALSDPDAAPILGPDWFAKAVLVLPGPKELFSLRVDSDLLAWFKAQGKGYQTRMNSVLRAYMKAHSR